MVHVFTTNKNGKIELTKDEIKKLLDEAYWDGYNNANRTYTYSTPTWSPYVWTRSGTTILNSNTVETAKNTITVTVTGNRME